MVSCVVWGECMCRAAVRARFLFQFLSLLLFSFIVVDISASTGIIWAPPPYQLVNAGSCNNKKKKKKNTHLKPLLVF